MVAQITKLDSPIDVMFLMHKVFMVHSERTELLAEQAQSGGSLNELEASLEGWLKQLLYHAQTEDTYMTGPLKDIEHQDGRRPARDNGQEHDELRRLGRDIVDFIGKGDKAALAEQVSAFVLSREDEGHADLAEKAESAAQALQQALGESRVLARTRRHLYQKVMALRIAEFDHFENEQSFVLPLVRDQMSPEQELELVRKLLFEDDADDPRWIIDFLYGVLESEDGELLKQLESSFAGSAVS
jgi:hypothetical protein